MKAIVTVVGLDRVGIIGELCTVLAGMQINIVDISQTVMRNFFTMIMLVDASQTNVPFARLVADLEQAGKEKGVVIHAQREEIFNAMHTI